MWFQRSHSGIALDVGPASVAVCQLVRARGRAALHRWGVLEDPLRERPEGTPTTAPALERIARLVRQARFYGREASLVLKPPELAFHTAAVPETMRGAPRPQWLTMLRFEAARQAQCEPEALEVDFWPLPPHNRSGDNVLIAAVHHNVLSRWCEVFDELGLALRTVDVLPCALLRSAWRSATAAPFAEDALWGVLDIGFSASLLAVALGSHCVYVRPLTVTGDSFTLAVGDGLGVDYHAAELLKRQYRPVRVARANRTCKSARDEPAGTGDTPADPADLGELNQTLQEMLRTPMRALAGELERAFAYAMESYPEATPSALFLSGNGARLPGLPESLHEHLGINVSMHCPLRDLPVTGRGFNPRDRAATGRERPADRGSSANGLGEAGLAGCVGLALGDIA